MLSLRTLEHAQPALRADVCLRVTKDGEALGGVSSVAPYRMFQALCGMPANIQPTHTDPDPGGGGAGS
jgi:hypothetical protein